jgi:hypothetical protein
MLAADLARRRVLVTASLITLSSLFDFAQTSFRALVAGEVHDLLSC